MPTEAPTAGLINPNQFHGFLGSPVGKVVGKAAEKAVSAVGGALTAAVKPQASSKPAYRASAGWRHR